MVAWSLKDFLYAPHQSIVYLKYTYYVIKVYILQKVYKKYTFWRN